MRVHLTYFVAKTWYAGATVTKMPERSIAQNGNRSVMFASHCQILEFSAGKFCQSNMELHPARVICNNTTNLLRKPCLMGEEWRHGSKAEFG